MPYLPATFTEPRGKEYGAAGVESTGGGRGGADGEQGTVTGRGFMQSDGGGGRGSLRGTEWVLEDIEGVVLFVQKVEIENKEALTNGTAGDKGDRGNT